MRHNSENHTTTLLKNDVKKLRSFEGQVSDTPVEKFLWCVCNHHASPYVMGVSYLKMSSHGTDGKLVGNCSQLINSTIPDIWYMGKKTLKKDWHFCFTFVKKNSGKSKYPAATSNHLSLESPLHATGAPHQLEHPSANAPLMLLPQLGDEAYMGTWGMQPIWSSTTRFVLDLAELLVGAKHI